MSKSIRIRDYLYAEIERLAKENRRPLINQLEILLEQALKAEGLSGAGRREGRESGFSQPSPLPAPESPSVDAQPRDVPARTIPFQSETAYERTYTPDFKKPIEKKKGRR